MLWHRLIRIIMHGLRLLFVGAWLLALTSCGGGGGSKSSPPPPPNPTPSLTSISPDNVTAGSSSLSLTANGSGFISSSVVRWNGSNRTTTFASGTQLTVSITATDIATGGTAQIAVFNPSPGGGTSPAVSLTINNPAPTISSLSPESLVAGGTDFTLTVAGSGFVPTSVIRWAGLDRPTTFVSGTEITATIPAADIAAGATIGVTVSNPAPGGGVSGAATFTINNPLPNLATLSPTEVTGGTSDFALTVTGSDFVPTSVVQWNGSDRGTTFVSNTQLTATIPASDAAASGTAQITVVNPSPSGGTSSAATFTINNPIPTIDLLSPPEVTSGGTDFTLAVNGSNFDPSSIIRWDGGDRPTTFISSTQLETTIAAAEITVGTIANVTVFNPTPAGGLSNAIVFTINNPMPVASSLSPTETVTGTADLTLTVTGSDFVPTSVIRLEGSDRTTTFVSSTELQTTLISSDLGQGGVFEITVFSPAPAGGSSTGLSFTINNPVPAPASLAPTSIPAGTNGFLLTVFGSDFVPNSVMRWNGTDQATTFISSTEVEAAIPASELLLDTTALVTVFSPTPAGGTSSTLPFTVAPAPGAFEHVNFATDGFRFSGSFAPDISGGGRLVAFIGQDPDNPVGPRQVWIRDTCLLADPDCARSTTKASVSNDGTKADNASWALTLSSDGRFVAFWSEATNLVVNDNNAADDVFVHDRDADQDGMFDEPGAISTIRASVDSNGAEANADSLFPSISADGRFVAFHSLATNLVSGDTNSTTDVFVRDTCAGAPGICSPSTVRVSVASDGSQGTGADISPSISADGRFVAFWSNSSNLVAGDTNATFDVFVHDRDTDADGIFDEPGSISTTRVSVDSGGAQTVGGSSLDAEISADGRYVAFTSNAANLVSGDTNGAFDVFVRDTCAGVLIPCTPSTRRVSVDNLGGEGDGDTGVLNISADGRFVAMQSLATNLVANDSNGVTDVFVRDTCNGADAGCVEGTRRASVADDGTEANGATSTARINATGRFIVLQSQASNLVPNDTNDDGDIFLGRSGFAATHPAPILTASSPSSATAGDAAFVLTVDGSGFVPASVVRWNGVDRTTIYLSATKLLVRIPASDLAAVGTADVIVINPPPGGGTSSILTFTVN